LNAFTLGCQEPLRKIANTCSKKAALKPFSFKTHGLSLRFLLCFQSGLAKGPQTDANEIQVNPYCQHQSAIIAAILRADAKLHGNNLDLFF